MAWSDKVRAAAALARGRWKGAKKTRSLALLRGVHGPVGTSVGERKTIANAIRMLRRGEEFVNPTSPMRAVISTRTRNLERYERRGKK